MKRSEMLKMMEEIINRDQYANYTLSTDSVEELLCSLEKVGMLPPKTTKTVIQRDPILFRDVGRSYVAVNEWEPE